MQKRHIELFLNGLVIVINPPFVHLSITGLPSKRTYERLGPPRLFRGERARHLTIPLEPYQWGKNAGKIDIHLTYLDGGRPRHVTIAMLTPQAIAASFKPIADALLDHYLRVVRRVTVEELRGQGYSVMLPTEEAEAWLDEHAEMRRWKLRLTDNTFERLTEHVDLYDPEVMNELRDAPEWQTLTLIREFDAPGLSVGYQPRGLGPERPPGWYAMPLDDTIGTAVDAVSPTAFGPPVYEALIVIARELQAEIDVDALERARERS